MLLDISGSGYLLFLLRKKSDRSKTDEYLLLLLLIGRNRQRMTGSLIHFGGLLSGYLVKWGVT